MDTWEEWSQLYSQPDPFSSNLIEHWRQPAQRAAPPLLTLGTRIAPRCIFLEQPPTGVYFPSYDLLYWAEHQQHPLEGLLVKIMYMAALRHNIRTGRENQQILSFEQQHQGKSVWEVQRAVSAAFPVFLNCFVTPCKSKIFQQPYQKLFPKLPAEQIWDTHQHQESHRSQLPSTSQTASRTALFRHCSSMPFLNGGSNTLKAPTFHQASPQETCLEKFKKLFAPPRSTTALGLFAVTWRCRHHQHASPALRASPAHQVSVTNCTNEGC